MRKIKNIMLILCLMLAYAEVSKAQILTPVHWSYAVKKISPNEAVVFIKADMEAGWHIYSQYVKEGGPVKTTVKSDHAHCGRQRSNCIWFAESRI